MEQRRSVLDRLSDLSYSDIQNELVEVRRERDRLDTLERMLQSLLDLVTNDAPNPVDQRTDRRTSSGDALFEDGTDMGGRGANRRAILAVMATDPARSWVQREVRDQLQQRGVEMTPENLRVTMRRMADKGELVKPAQGRFKLAATAEEDG